MKRRPWFALAQAFLMGNPWLVATVIANLLGKTKKHYVELRKLFKWLKHLSILSHDLIGLRLLVCGKLGARTQTRFKYLSFGRPIYTQMLAARLRYGYAEAETFTGTFGIHIWFLHGGRGRVGE